MSKQSELVVISQDGIPPAAPPFNPRLTAPDAGTAITTTYTVTVGSYNGANRYYLNTIVYPKLTLSLTYIYIFDLSDSTNTGHPLRFKDEAGSSYSTGVVVTGTPGSAGAKVTLTVAANAPDNLRYYCTVHGNGMGNTISVTTAASLDVGTNNYFDSGNLTDNTSLNFTSVPTTANWKYSYKNNFIGNSFNLPAEYTEKSFSVAVQIDEATGMYFKSDGTKMYVLSDRNENDQIYEYNLSTAWDISTASYSTVASISEGRPTGIFWRADGTKFYICGYTGDSVYEYNASTAWSVGGGISLVRSFSVSSQDNSPHEVFFKPNGLKMYVMGDQYDKIYEYNLSTAWNISTASYSQSLSVTGEDTSPIGFYITPDGLKLFVAGTQSNSVYQYALSTAWDITSAVKIRIFIVNSQDVNPQSVFFKPDGLVMYILGYTNRSVFQYDVGYVPSVSMPSSVVETPSVPLRGKRVTYDFVTTNSGSTVNLIAEEII